MTLRVATMGDNCVDTYLPPVGLTAIGGQALNVAINWRRMGLSAEYLGAVGDDAPGRRVLAAVLAEAVASDRVQILPGRTGTTHLRLMPNGDRVVAFEDQGVCARYSPLEDDLDHLVGATYVHAANLRDFRTVARRLADRGVPMSYDFSTGYETDDLHDIDTVFYSWPGKPDDEELADLATRAQCGGANVIVATCGERGSVVFEGDRADRASAVAVSAVDTCGAGDTYAARLLADRLSGVPLPEAMAAAAAAAAAACLHIGAWEQPLEPLNEVST